MREHVTLSNSQQLALRKSKVGRFLNVFLGRFGLFSGAKLLLVLGRAMPAALRTSAFISTALMSLVILGAQEKWKKLTDKAHGMTKHHWWNDTGELGIPNTFFFRDLVWRGGANNWSKIWGAIHGAPEFSKSPGCWRKKAVGISEREQILKKVHRYTKMPSWMIFFFYKIFTFYGLGFLRGNAKWSYKSKHISIRRNSDPLLKCSGLSMGPKLFRVFVRS